MRERETEDHRIHVGSNHIAQRIQNALFTPDQRMEVPPFPRNMQLEPTNFCNYHCLFCASSKIKKGSHATMEPNLFEALARQAFALGTREVGLYSRGEPLLCPDLEDYVKLCKEIGYTYIYLTTNGSLATPERLESLIRNGIDSIKFSVNAATEETYKIIHGNGSLELITEHIKCAHKLRQQYNPKLYLAVSCVQTEIAANEKQFMLNRFEGYVDTVLFSPARTHGGHIQGYANQHDSRTFCNIPFNMLNITSSGYLAACCVDFTDDLLIADLRDEPLAEAWKNTRFRLIRKKHLSGDLSGLQCARCLQL